MIFRSDRLRGIALTQQSLWRTVRADWWPEIRTVLALAVPVVVAELGWVAMGVVDTIMVGALGPASIGAIAVGSSFFYSFAIFGNGLMLGLDALVSRAHGAGDRADARRSLAAAVRLALILGPVLNLIFWLMPGLFPFLGISPEVRELSTSFLRALSFSVLPLLLHNAFRRYLQATGHPEMITFTLVTANLINWAGNWVLIYGHAGFPALGVAGSALSTVMARLYMFATLALAFLWFERRKGPLPPQPPQGLDWHRLNELVRLGFPAASQIVLEVGAFNSVAVLAARLTANALAAHQVAISLAATAFMVPLGISSAAAVLVGQSLGRRAPALGRHHGNIAIGLALAFEVVSGAAFFFFPETLIRLYTNDSGVIEIGRILLRYAAAFQLFDGLQTVTTGALRGLGDTRTPMLVNLLGYWALGLPAGYWLCFYRGVGVAGLWFGLTVALILIATALGWTWVRASGRLLQRMTFSQDGISKVQALE